MPKTTNDNSKYFREWSTKKLKEEAISYDEIIHNSRCHGTKDISNWMGICLELEKRGIEIHTNIKFKR